MWLYFRFIRAYKNLRGTKSLASFYEDYHVEFEPHQDGAEFIIEILKQLRESGLSRVANKFFLVSVYKDAPMTANNTELPDWQYSHVAGDVSNPGLRLPDSYKPNYEIISSERTYFL